ncbi:response regulator transcription factor [Bacillus sp. UNCCL81]|uniref:response regulator transcription factor n=1 Tax=Bacillus sp. UNCCL81 TaxID=1502755 RepID=UPI0003F4B697|nr:response regulator transcription factor [Bacillus sp. UNCCL81]SFD60190.1 DNA-binding response regulator, NarL/FixJ family, contains REC and HTH domains [Bacillus sp. UNCCL81]
MNKIGLLIVEDDPVWMDCLCKLVEREKDIVVVEKVSTKEAALNVDCTKFDVALLDLSLTDNVKKFEGIEIADYLRSKNFYKVIMLTSWEDKDTILNAFDKGVMNYVAKKSFRDIPNAIKEAYQNNHSLHSDATNIVLSELLKERRMKKLTKSEREVYELHEKGLKKNEIASILYKSVETIKLQIKNIRKKIEK